MHIVAAAKTLSVVADKGNDEPEADNNPDGRPRYNLVQKNDIYSDKDEVWKITDADSNVFRVSAPLFPSHMNPRKKEKQKQKRLL